MKTLLLKRAMAFKGNQMMKLKNIAIITVISLLAGMHPAFSAEPVGGTLIELSGIGLVTLFISCMACFNTKKKKRKLQ